MAAERPHCTVEGATVRLTKFIGQYQAQSTWCWAAAAASIDQYYVDREAKEFGVSRQCFFVHRVFGRKVCRAGLHADPRRPDEPDCQKRECSIKAGDESGRLDLALMGVKDAPLGSPSRNFTRFFERSKPTPVGFSQIVAEIDHGDPMAIRIEQPGGTHHMLVPGIARSRNMA